MCHTKGFATAHLNFVKSDPPPNPGFTKVMLPWLWVATVILVNHY